MVRIGAFLVGLFFAGWLLISFLVGAYSYVVEPPAKTVEHEFHLAPKHVSFSFDGPLGRYDNQQLQRGFLQLRRHDQVRGPDAEPSSRDSTISIG